MSRPRFGFPLRGLYFFGPFPRFGKFPTLYVFNIKLINFF